MALDDHDIHNERRTVSEILRTREEQRRRVRGDRPGQPHRPIYCQAGTASSDYYSRRRQQRESLQQALTEPEKGALPEGWTRTKFVSDNVKKALHRDKVKREVRR